MTAWSALLPTEESVVLEEAIRLAAKRLKVEGFTGTFEQARADAFLDLALHHAHVAVNLDLSVPVQTLDEFDTDHTHDETGDPLYPDPNTDDHASDEHGTETGTEPDDVPEPEAVAGSEPQLEATVEPEPESVVPRGPGADPEPGDEDTDDEDGEDPVATVGREAVIPAAFLRPAAGDYLRDLQAECCLPDGRGVPVPGLGIIPVHRLRDWLDSLDTTFRRVLINTTTGLPIDVAATRYRPGARLATLIRLRDGTCRFPYCDAPAQICDLDHVIPHPFGPTVATNLMALCRRHHRLKTHTRWEPTLDPDTAHVTWTDPYGQTHTTTPQTDHLNPTVNPDTS